MRTLLIILLYLTYSANALSQNFYKGRLISALTGKPIRSGFIEMNGNILTSTDTSGYFTIKIDSSSFDKSGNIALGFSSPEAGNIIIGDLSFKKDEILEIFLKPECQYSAQKDISENKIKLLLVFNFISKPLRKKDKAFEKKYNLLYFGYGDGCTGIVTDCIKIYNKAIGEYLDKRYGKKWREKVNAEVFGL